jgi:hypothetical protein
MKTIKLIFDYNEAQTLRQIMFNAAHYFDEIRYSRFAANIYSEIEDCKGSEFACSLSENDIGRLYSIIKTMVNLSKRSDYRLFLTRIEDKLVM